MILNIIINAVIAVMEGVLSILPTVPATPSAVVTSGTWVTDQISNVISVLNMVYTPTLLSAIMVIIIGMFTFEWIYHTVLWIVRKIPVIGIS